MSAGRCLDCGVVLTQENAYRCRSYLQNRCKQCDNKNRARRLVRASELPIDLSVREHTYDEIGAALGVSRQRAHQIALKAMKKLASAALRLESERP